MAGQNVVDDAEQGGGEQAETVLAVRTIALESGEEGSAKAMGPF